MKSPRAFYFLYHVLSQIMRKTGFLQVDHKNKKAPHFIESWTLKDWEIFCHEEFKNIKFFKENQLWNLSQTPKLLYECLQKTLDSGGSLICLDDPFYPDTLKAISDHPLCVFCLGNKQILKNQLVAIIGSRRASKEALDESFHQAYSLVTKGYTIVSGGAYGCDIMAHQGALEAKSKENSTITVFAGGLHKLYPKGNFSIFRRIIDEGGALVSERLWDQESMPYDFPIRNRIISGLCENILVMDAGLKSGSMVTAQVALDQGRNVYVLKPPFCEERSLGIENLIEDGAQTFKQGDEVSNILWS